MIYFSSDHHFGHENILKYCNRPFKDLEEMHLEMIRRHNAVVTPKDEVWFLGDLVYRAGDFEQIKRYINMMRGTKHLVFGNHDKKYREELKNLFATTQDYKELKFNKRKFVLMHFPIHSWNGAAKGTIHLHGHSHGTLADAGIRRFDVGVDVFDFTPISMDRIVEMADERPVFKEFSNEQAN